MDTDRFSTMSKILLSYRDAACTETQTRALLAASRELLAIVSRAGEFLFVNENFTQTLGYAPGELLGKPLFCLNPPADAGHIREKFAQIAAGGSEPVLCRCSLRAKSGEYRWFEAAAFNRLDDPGVQGVLLS